MADLRLPRRKLTDATHTSSLRKSYWTKLVGLFNKFNSELQPGLNRMMTRTSTIKEFSDKLNNTSDITIYAGMPRVVDENVKLSYKAGKERAAVNPRIRRESILINPKFSIYDMSIIEDLKTRNFGLVTKLTEDIKSDLLRIMTDGMNRGKSYIDVSKEISNQIEGISKARALTIARTETSYSYHKALSESYKQVGIKEWQWYATLGYECCDECIERHGEIYDWSDEQPPLHPNCYCSMYPVIDTGE